MYEDDTESVVEESTESRGGAAQFFLSRNGGTSVFHPADSQALLDEVLRCLEAADSVLRLAVPNDLVGDMRSKSVDTLEVLLPSNRTSLLTSLGGTSVEYTRILVPVSGEWIDGVTTLFYGAPNYSHGPLRQSEAPTKLLGLLSDADGD